MTCASATIKGVTPPPPVVGTPFLGSLARGGFDGGATNGGGGDDLGVAFPRAPPHNSVHRIDFGNQGGGCLRCLAWFILNGLIFRTTRLG